MSRGKGKSAVAAAAYRAGEIITNQYDGISHDYTRKSGVVHTEILLPDNAPKEYADRSTLWNAVEQIEKNKNSQLAREIELALPVELSREQNISLTHEYVNRHFVSAGMCADICIHDKNDGNPHAHVMLTMRPIGQGGSWGAKSRKEYILDENGERILLKSGAFKTRKIDATNWNEQTKAEEWRAGWAGAVNAALERQGHAERVDHRSYERQGVEQIPTIHLGVEAFQMEKKGIPTERGDRNREVGKINQLLRQLQARINKLKNWLQEELKNAVPAFAALFAETVEKVKARARHFTGSAQQLSDEAFRYLKENNISDMAGLSSKVNEVRERLYTVRGELRNIEQRMSGLDKLIAQAETYMKHKNIGLEYRQLKPRKQEKFRRSHETELLLFESAERYLKQYAGGAVLPLREWRAAREKLALVKDGLYQDYRELQKDLQAVEAVQRTVKHVMHLPKKENIRERDRGLER
ncbi:MobA/MobL family protein [Eubacteriales bacterium OttesenSCG-928-K08]|nr:MobA/MobL family protein [Eubacteriales bacterium OttesenSCG-928-K08]